MPLENEKPQIGCLKVSSKSSAASVAGAIAGMIKDGSCVEIQSVGAGAVVTSDVAPYALVVGVPARRVFLPLASKSFACLLLPTLSLTESIARPFASASSLVPDAFLFLRRRCSFIEGLRAS